MKFIINEFFACICDPVVAGRVHLFTTFWSLSLYDIWVPEARYKEEISRIEQAAQELETNAEMVGSYTVFTCFLCSCSCAMPSLFVYSCRFFYDLTGLFNLD